MRTGVDADDGATFWEHARMINHQLRQQRSREGILTASRMVEAAITPDADSDSAKRFLIAGLSNDLSVTNLGVRLVPSHCRLTPSALWGPVQLTQVAEETVTGVITYGGRMRLTKTGYMTTDGFLATLVDTLQRC
ncbi:hypothetical protein MARA_01040 (plasmid) [Mycolicibacterium arabiense]|uniref:Uncharacterized protein n=2 Tax=Mycolicibacterium arabiense TaxID=1286181 RepID=A0A7I7RQ18_9MYCO|nr:hypothetical protein MARA_01040 [Mycolicibacterium arabiense]